MNTKKIFLFYFCIGIIGTISIQMLPLIFKDKGFTIDQITTLISIIFISAIFQPIIGYITKKWITNIKMLKLLLVFFIISSSFMFITNEYYTIMLLTLLFSIARSSLSPMYDSYVTSLIHQKGGNYGLVRSGASLGFGLGLIILALFIFVFQMSYNFTFICLIGVSIGALILSQSMKVVPKVLENEKEYQKNNTSWHVFLLLVLIYALYFGGVSIRITYISSYYIEFGYNLYFIALATFIMVIPEVVFLPLYNRLFLKYNKVFLLGLSISMGVIQLLLYRFFYEMPIILLLASTLNGFQIMLFFPTFFMLLNRSLGIENASFGFLINFTIQALFVGIYNQLVIKHVYVATQTSLSVIWTIIFVTVLAFIPLMIYNIKYYKS